MQTPPGNACSPVSNTEPISSPDLHHSNLPTDISFQTFYINSGNYALHHGQNKQYINVCIYLFIVDIMLTFLMDIG